MVALSRGIKDIYVQMKKEDPIKHISREKLMKELETSHKNNLKALETFYKSPADKTACGAESCSNCGKCR